MEAYRHTLSLLMSDNNTPYIDLSLTVMMTQLSSAQTEKWAKKTKNKKTKEHSREELCL